MKSTRQSVKIRKNSFEKEAWAQNLVIAGIDEVGRGCLAGPLVAAAVILPCNARHALLKDSKVMTHEERLEAYAWITKKCWFGIGILHNRHIDSYNIWQTTLSAMKKALLNAIETCPLRPAVIVIDAMPLSLADTAFNDIPVHHFYKGESKSSSIAAASIVAKVTRDGLMNTFDTIIPGYSLASSKGYGTVAHRKALQNLDYSIIHRTSFLHNLETPYDDMQLSIDSFLQTINEGIVDDDQELLWGGD
jgi:ribonuclease HII